MIFVTVGFHVAFDRLVQEMDRLAETLPEPVLMQIGHSNHEPRHAEFYRFAPTLAQDMEKARLVIAQGAMSLVEAIRLEKAVVAVPRLLRFGEHLNDHQLHFARAMEERLGIPVVTDISTLGQAIQAAQPVSFGTSQAREDLIQFLSLQVAPT